MTRWKPGRFGRPAARFDPLLWALNWTIFVQFTSRRKAGKSTLPASPLPHDHRSLHARGVPPTAHVGDPNLKPPPSHPCCEKPHACDDPPILRHGARPPCSITHELRLDSPDRHPAIQLEEHTTRGPSADACVPGLDANYRTRTTVAAVVLPDFPKGLLFGEAAESTPLAPFSTAVA